MTRFFDPEDPFNPGHDLMRRWVRGLIEIDDSVPDVFGQRPLERGVTGGKRRVVSGSHVEAVVVLEEDRPLGSVNGGCETLGFDQKVDVVLVWTGVGTVELVLGV